MPVRLPQPNLDITVSISPVGTAAPTHTINPVPPPTKCSLFRRVVEHRRAYFKQAWVDYDTMAPGTLRLVPDEARMTAWEKDYEAM